MNIKDAKQQIKNAIVAYFSKDSEGNYVLPIEKQRPVFLMGPPGVGKTAIMQQIADELGVGILSYSMTHHTRQSLLGLPMIEHKMYGGKEYAVSEYTMSEIIASVYDNIERTGQSEGILFVDEINCVSETLAPIMLQFLQYKVLGKHHVPDGWIVVTAGNPPEYNNSVKEFDLVTWDRLKRIDIEPDFGAWKEYAYARNVHPSVIAYLNRHPDKFYSISTTVGGKEFVTARGWDDLSQMIRLYEQNGILVDQNVISQYVQSKKIAREFAQFYDLFTKYQDDYEVDKILDGEYSDSIVKRANKAAFDEKYALIGLILDNIDARLTTFLKEDDVLRSVAGTLRPYKSVLRSGDNQMEHIIEAKEKDIEKATINHHNDYASKLRAEIKIFSIINAEIRKNPGVDMFEIANRCYKERVELFHEAQKDIGNNIENIMKFAEEAFGVREIDLIMTEFSANPKVTKYISCYGSSAYNKYADMLLINGRQRDIKLELESLSID